MAKQWSQGIAKGKDALWEILQKWIVDKLDEVRNSFEKSANEIIDLADRALENQLQVIESNFEDTQKFWDDFAVKKEALTAVKNELEEEVKYKEN
jgi:prophage DNA circulation protein